MQSYQGLLFVRRPDDARLPDFLLPVLIYSTPCKFCTLVLQPVVYSRAGAPLELETRSGDKILGISTGRGFGALKGLRFGLGFIIEHIPAILSKLGQTLFSPPVVSSLIMYLYGVVVPLIVCRYVHHRGKCRHYSGNRHYSACCHSWLLPSAPNDFTGTVAGDRHYRGASTVASRVFRQSYKMPTCIKPVTRSYTTRSTRDQRVCHAPRADRSFDEILDLTPVVCGVFVFFVRMKEATRLHLFSCFYKCKTVRLGLPVGKKHRVAHAFLIYCCELCAALFTTRAKCSDFWRRQVALWSALYIRRWLYYIFDVKP